jgi:hypothetical protein
MRGVVGSENLSDRAMLYIFVVLSGQRTFRTGQCHTYAWCCRVSEFVGPGNAIHIRCVVWSANFSDWAMPYIYAVLSGQRICLTGNAIHMRSVFGSANFSDRAMPYICVVLSGQRIFWTGQCHSCTLCCRVSEIIGPGNAIHMRGVVGSAICWTGQCHTYR